MLARSLRQPEREHRDRRDRTQTGGVTRTSLRLHPGAGHPVSHGHFRGITRLATLDRDGTCRRVLNSRGDSWCCAARRWADRPGCGSTSAFRIAFSVTSWTGGYAHSAYITRTLRVQAAGTGLYQLDSVNERRLARSLRAVADTDAGIAVRQGAGMAKEQNVYTTIGVESGCGGHRHRRVREAGRCLDEYRRQEFSDRRVGRRGCRHSLAADRGPRSERCGAR